jgi:mannose-6-phosphate isomerase
MLKLMSNPIQNYDWGSRTALAALQGRPAPTELPEAELWLGAHPAAPSTVAGDGGGEPVALTQLIEADPLGAQGEAVVARFGTRLPYLMKVLAIAAPLSLQVHPGATQAAEGHARERAQEVSPQLANYRDPWPKPELLCALTDVHALCGFRPAAAALRLLDALDVPGLRPITDLLRDEPVDAARAAALAMLVQWPAESRTDLVAALRSRAGTLVRSAAEPDATDLRWIADLAGRYPHDAGVACVPLLDRLHLAPGEALFLPAGQLHAYLRGTAVEIMGNSDNVLRAGLTTKRVDPAELLSIVDTSLPARRVTPTASGPVLRYGTDAAEFELVRATVDGHPVTLRDPGPRIVLCIDGRTGISAGGTVRQIGPGASVFAPAAAGPLTISGRGTAFVATVPVSGQPTGPLR